MRLTFVERWADMAALQVHFRVDASRSFGKAMARLGGAAPEIHVYQSDEIDLRAQPA
jgi:quinol monooxygenase YgiN